MSHFNPVNDNYFIPKASNERLITPMVFLLECVRIRIGKDDHLYYIFVNYGWKKTFIHDWNNWNWNCEIDPTQHITGLGGQPGFLLGSFCELSFSAVVIINPHLLNSYLLWNSVLSICLQANTVILSQATLVNMISPLKTCIADDTGVRSNTSAQNLITA